MPGSGIGILASRDISEIQQLNASTIVGVAIMIHEQ